MVNYIVVGKARYLAVAVLQAIRSFTGAKSILIGEKETAVLAWSSLCRRQVTIRLDGSEDEKFVSLINRLAEQMPHLVLIPADCDGIRIINRVRSRIWLKIAPIPDLPTLQMFDDKWHFHQFCMRNGLSVPATRYIGSKFDLDFDAVASELGLPFVIKPINQSGSIGVQVVRGKAQFEEAVRENPEYRCGPLIAQRYIEGDDIDLSLLAVRGRLSAVAIQRVYGREVRFVPNAYLEEAAAELCRLSGYNGVMHVDARIEKGTQRVYLLESNPRFWASLAASVWCGLNFVEQSIERPPFTNSVHRLTAGTASTRHPLMRPSSWPRLLTDRGARGRLLRAMVFDLLAFTDLLRAPPLLLWQHTGGWLSTRSRSARKGNAYLRTAPPGKAT
ncbi:ATP-grasp domain-containing protein [Noviherbaspirillum massiliense]|uniref:ATP-grasp domain-containing protein n=1 Tax=Noviherbaspirillum massiliense TaxID=1465823 RepID=UPI0002EB547A|nr:ATP-grasp domain-containing protein [Noviherbaspirillum massiliense]